MITRVFDPVIGVNGLEIPPVTTIQNLSFDI